MDNMKFESTLDRVMEKGVKISINDAIVKIWRYKYAPECLKELYSKGGDEEHLIYVVGLVDKVSMFVIKKLIRSLDVWDSLDVISRDCCIYVTAHS